MLYFWWWKLSLPAGGVAALARHRLPRTCSGVLRVRVKAVLKGKFGKSNDLVKRSELSLKYFGISQNCMNSHELGQAEVAIIRYLKLSEKAKWLQEVMARSAATGQLWGIHVWQSCQEPVLFGFALVKFNLIRSGVRMFHTCASDYWMFCVSFMCFSGQPAGSTYTFKSTRSSLCFNIPLIYRPFVFRPPIKDLAMELASDPGHIPSVGCLAGLDWFETILAADVEVSATSTPLDLFSDPGVVSAKEAGHGTVLEKSREMTPARIAALIYPK